VAAVTTAYKFLTAEGLGMFSGFAWPLPGSGPGAWVEAEVDACRTGVHACRRKDLPYWVGPALYEIELDGPLDTLALKVWNSATRDEYSRMCVARARELVDTVSDLADWAPPPSIGLWEAARLGFVAARIAEQIGGIDAYLDERRRQSDWLVEQLALG
jgi:hypothetical protein